MHLTLQFTTLACIPGIIQYNDSKIQLCDLPGIIQGAASGKGRGKQVIGVARTADVILMVLDAEKADVQRRLLTFELESVGIRPNQKRPDCSIRIKKTGGISLNATCELTHCDLLFVRETLQLYKMHNVDVLMREDLTQDEFIDCIENNRIYTPVVYVCNKVDNVTLDIVDRLAHRSQHVVISVRDKLNLDYLVERIWQELAFIRVYTKRRAIKPDFTDPLIMKKGSTVESVCAGIHRSMVS